MRLFVGLFCLVSFLGCDRPGEGPKRSCSSGSAVSTWSVDSELTRRYGSLPGPGKARRSDGLEAKLKVCLRQASTEKGAHRTWVGVCTELVDASHAQPGLIDLLVFADSQGVSRVVAETTGLESGSFGEPGEVELVEVGPRLRAFALSSSFTGMGSIIETLDWYVQEGSRMRGILSSQLYASNEGMSPCDDDSLACRWEGRKLEIDSSSVRSGHFSLVVWDTARKDGQFPTSRSRVDFDADSGRYVLPAPLIPEFW